MKYSLFFIFLISCGSYNPIDDIDSGTYACESVCNKITKCLWYDEIVKDIFDSGNIDSVGKYNYCFDVCSNGKEVENYKCLDSIIDCNINNALECF